MSVVRVKPGVEFSIIAPGGFRILSALEQACRKLDYGDFTITSGTEGEHSGPTDPHKRGEAYDLRSKDFSEALRPVILNAILAILGTENFFGFMEAPGTDNEHFHFQVRKGMTYP